MKIALIPAAGSSTRFKELGKQYAKTVLPFEGMPIICHILNSLEQAKKFDEYYIIVNNDLHRQQIEEAVRLVKINKPINVCQFKETDDQVRGPGNTIQQGLRFIPYKNYSLMVHLSDSLFDILHLTNMPLDSVSTQPVLDQSRWCVITPENEYVNKPKEVILGARALSGIYYFSTKPNPVVFQPEGESQISSILEAYQFPLRAHYLPIKKDFGTIEEYNIHRGIRKSRSFNEVIETLNYVKKTCRVDEHKERLLNEIHWYNQLPFDLKPYVPAIYDYHPSIYPNPELVMEKLKGTNLRDLCLYLDRSESTWDEIFGEVWKMIVDFEYHFQITQDNFLEKIYKKTVERSLSMSDHPVVNSFLREMEFMVYSSPNLSNSIIHGDLHFSNMFYDFHHKELKVIDPRGDLSGNLLYDIAKLNHSVNGNYDWIDGELYTYDEETDHVQFLDAGREGIQRSFTKIILGKFSDKERRIIDILTASLFLSMIPLHYHNKTNQKLFFNEFLRLSKDIVL